MRRIPHPASETEVRQTFQRLTLQTDVLTAGAVGAVLIAGGVGVVPSWSTSLTTLTFLTVDNISIDGAVISSDSGAISFSDENLTTAGTIAGINVTSGADPGHTHTGASLTIDHGDDLVGLGDDDHTQYLLADGSRNLTGNMAVDAAITIDGRDLSVDGDKLDGIEDGADVTDADNVAGAGAAMSGGAFHDGFSDFVAAEHVALPSTIAAVLTDHDLAAHTTLGLFDQSSDVDHDTTTNTHNLTTDIDHDALTNYDANDHIDHTTVSVSPGSGLSGGGTIAATRTLSLDINSLDVAVIAAGDFIPFWDITATATNKKITFANFEGTLAHDSLSGYDANKHVDHTGVSISTGSGLTGGGDISSTRTLALDINGLVGESAIVAADTIPFYDDTAGANRKVTFAQFQTALGASTDKYVGVDAAATPGYLGVAANDGVLRTDSTIAWTDGGDYVTLTTNPGYVSRGDPSGWDWVTGVLTFDNTWRDLDLSSIVPSGTYAVLLKCQVKATVAGKGWWFKKKGNSNTYSAFKPTAQVANIYGDYEGIIEIDSNGKIEYMGNSEIKGAGFVVKGWFI